MLCNLIGQGRWCRHKHTFQMAIYAMEKAGPGERDICYFCKVVREGNTEVTFKQVTGSKR